MLFLLIQPWFLYPISACRVLPFKAVIWDVGLYPKGDLSGSVISRVLFFSFPPFPCEGVGGGMGQRDSCQVAYW